MVYSEKFNYPTVSSESTSSNGRVYFIEHEGIKYHTGLPSVTTIISSQDTTTKDAIQKWKNQIGVQAANEITRQSIELGNAMHDILYYRLINKPILQKPSSFIEHLANTMADRIQETYLEPYLDEIWGAEVPLFVPNMYAGRVDLVGIYRGVPSIIDFKNSRKEKPKEYMAGYFTQEAAYATAHNFLFGTNIKNAVTLVAQRLIQDVVPKEVIITGEEFNEYQSGWIDKLKAFHKIS